MREGPKHSSGWLHYLQSSSQLFFLQHFPHVANFISLLPGGSGLI